MVACSPWLMPWRVHRQQRVPKRISASSQRLRWSTYHTSSMRRWSHGRALRPFTCAHPVIPGRTSWRRNCSGEYRSRYSIRSGRGPTRLISPRITFHSSGNSSRLIRRRKAPKRVILSASQPSPMLIVRNFRVVNGFPRKPGRLWRNRTGLPMVHQTQRATRTIMGIDSKIATEAISRSSALFAVWYW